MCQCQGWWKVRNEMKHEIRFYEHSASDATSKTWLWEKRSEYISEGGQHMQQVVWKSLVLVDRRN